MSKPNQFTAQQFIDAIPGTGGIVTAISQRVGCSWPTAKKYIETHPTVQAAYDAECEAVGDIAESVLIRNIRYAYEQQARTKEPVDAGDAKWYITRKLKDRGYVERQEHTGADGGVIEIELSWEDARIGESEN